MATVSFEGKKGRLALMIRKDSKTGRKYGSYTFMFDVKGAESKMISVQSGVPSGFSKDKSLWFRKDKEGNQYISSNGDRYLLSRLMVVSGEYDNAGEWPTLSFSSIEVSSGGVPEEDIDDLLEDEEDEDEKKPAPKKEKAKKDESLPF